MMVLALGGTLAARDVRLDSTFFVATYSELATGAGGGAGGAGGGPAVYEGGAGGGGAAELL